ncbi:MAG: CBS domain-containing protein [Planctomycetaceae bacterium]|nr:CBS domain-containing protein [Planctomycetales bacterium]MCB9873334.1 CBS domain-containing protein [Planctomycetaceae bacterium]MCB9941148.1 CBS domain-containing protein [Planctomycetaceae bacterium]HRX78263.1 CBS domain-containing protein [Pirellulaceae bacterium]
MVKTISKLRVKDVMSKHVVAVNPSDSLHEALELICENRVSALPVVDGHGHCVGILTTSDLIELTHELDDELHNLGRVNDSKPQWLIEQLAKAMGSERVSEQMTPDVAAICPEATIPEAAALMLRNRVHHLPVVDNNNLLRGIVSTMDILSIVAEGVPSPSSK